MQAGGEAVKLVLQEGEALGHPDQQHVDAAGRLVPGRQEPYGVVRRPGAPQVRPGRLPAEEGVADLHGTVCGERGGQGAPPVAQHDHRAGQVHGPGVDPVEVPQ
ncbi:hypothetical protein GCM10009530_55960 [Microbispora corallina]|uniref:Uncharacterized protein n=1 Tax=Microbispora corallina TaxID=83302 RepID=A0ABQ4GCB9_9ACTN|nr:hypothetical protein Mco01_76430 [Microbispora corallina]